MFSFSSEAISNISRQLDVCALRHEVYSANVANADVAGYERLEVIQQDAQIGFEKSTESPSSRVINTHEAVLLDQEMARLSKNALRYELMLTTYQRTVGIVNAAIKEGRGA